MGGTTPSTCSSMATTQSTCLLVAAPLLVGPSLVDNLTTPSTCHRVPLLVAASLVDNLTTPSTCHRVDPRLVSASLDNLTTPSTCHRVVPRLVPAFSQRPRFRDLRCGVC